MADNVEEFILKYNVDVAETLRKLDALNEKLDKTGKKGKQSVQNLGTEIRAVAKEFVVAGAAIAGAMATVAKGIKMATDAMKEYKEQSLLARRSGVSPLMQEAVGNNLARASRGRIGVAESRQSIDAVANALMSAFTDPTKSNTQNIKFSQMGVKTTGANGQIADAGETMNELGKRWKQMSLERAEAEGKALELTPQVTAAIRDLGGAVTDTSNLTLAAVQRQDEAAKAAVELEEATTGITKDFREMTKVLIDDAMPALAAYYKQIQKDTHNFAQKLSDEGTMGFLNHAGRYYKKAWSNLWDGKGIPTTREEQDALWDDTGVKKTEEEKRDDDRKKNDILDRQRDAAKGQQSAAANNVLATNQFSAAVAAMPGSLSMQQAIAMWAGEFGKGQTTGGAGYVSGSAPAGGSMAPGGSRHVATVTVGAGDHGSIVSSLMSKGWTESQAVGIAANLHQESSYDHTAVGDGGKAYGIGQWHPDRQANFKKVFGKDIKESTLEEQIAFVDWELRNTEKGAGGRLMGANSAGDAASIVSQYYERPKDRYGEASRRSAKATAMAGGLRTRPTGAQGMATGQRQMVQDGIARRIGMKTEQFKREGATSGDVQYGIAAQRRGFEIEILKLENEVKSFQAAGKPLAANEKAAELYQMRQQMQMFEKYSPGILQDARPGDRERTQGMTIINVNGVTDPVANALEIKKIMGQEMGKVVNEVSSKHVG